MKPNTTVSIAAAFSLALCMAVGANAQVGDPQAVQAPPIHHSQSADTTNQQKNNSMNQNSTAEAKEMVATSGALVNTLDSKKAKQGQEFRIKLPRKVTLKNGTEIPANSILVGKVGQDDMNQAGKSKLVLCIDHAQLKGRKTMSVKADIVGIAPPGLQSSEYYMPQASGDQSPNPWHNGVTKIDEIDALHNVDLHSNVNSKNSAVLVSKKDDDIKIKSGTQIDLAIAPANDTNQQQGMNNNSGSR